MDVLLALIAAVIGAAVGSFLNVVIHRVPTGASIVSPPSACPSCEQLIRPRDNIPVVSFVLLRGRCRHCAARISPRYPIVELLTAGLFALAAVRFDSIEESGFVAVASAVLVALTFIDLDHRRVPNKIVIPAAAAAAVWVVVVGLVSDDTSMIWNSIGSGIGGYLFLGLIAFISPKGMGFGDVKLARFIGVVTGRFGWEAFVLAMFSGFMAGGVIGIALLLSGRGGRKTAIPFAPMLCLGALIGLYAGPGPVRAWLGL